MTRLIIIIRSIPRRSDMEPLVLDVDTAVPVGLIANELLTNAFKYAFEGRDAGHIRISIKAMEAEGMVMRISDDGVGMVLGAKAKSFKNLADELNFD